MKSPLLIIMLLFSTLIYSQEVDSAKKSNEPLILDTSQYNYYRGRITDIGFFIKVNPNNYRYYFERGSLYLLIGKYNQALFDINKACEIEPNNSDLLLIKSKLNAIKNVQRWMKGVADINDYKSINFNEFFIQNYSEIIQAKLKTNSKVVYSIVHTYSIKDALFEGTYFHLDSSLNVIGKLTFLEMIAITNELLPIDVSEIESDEQRVIRATNEIKKNPNDWVNYTIRAGAKDELKDTDGAILDYLKAIELIPKKQEHYYEDLPLLYTNLGRLKFQKQEISEGYLFLDKALEFNPKYALAYLIRGIKKCETQVNGFGCDDINKAIEIDSYLLNSGIISKEKAHFCCDKISK